MSSRWLAAFLEAGGDAPVVTLPPRAGNAKIAKNKPAKVRSGTDGCLKFNAIDCLCIPTESGKLT